MHTRIICLTTIVILVTLPAAARAGDLYVAPSAHGSGDCSTAADACTPATAFGNAVAGDRLLLTAAEGAYTFGTSINVTKKLALVGVGERPRLIFPGSGGLFLTGGSGSSARHLYVEASSDAFSIPWGGTADDVIAKATGSFATACFFRDTTLSNSVCFASGSGGVAYHVQANFAPTTDIAINVTAYAPGTGGGQSSSMRSAATLSTSRS